MAAGQQIGVNHEDGMNIGGASTDKVAFWAATPVARPAVTFNATITASWVTLSAGTGFGIGTSNEIISLIGAVKDMQHVLTSLGLWS
jgi:hypothetical protein